MPPRARKRFGQHFLHEQGIVNAIVGLIDPGPDDAIVEIGPGRGALTLPLLHAAGRLTAVELDRDLIAGLQRACAGIGDLTLHQGDALRVDYATLAGGRPIRLVGNLPYNISTPLLFHLLASQAVITDMHFMLQKEVVDRITAEPGSRTYGRLSVAVAARADADSLLSVAPGAFTPPPAVQSAVVRLVPRPPAFAITNWDGFERLITQAFSRRRKTLRNALAGLLDDAAIRAAGIDPGLRPEQLAPGDFAALANALDEPP